MNYSHLIFCFLSLFSIEAHAQTCDTLVAFYDSVASVPDTVPVIKQKLSFKDRIDVWGGSRLVQSTYVGVPLLVGAMILRHQDIKFHHLQDHDMPRHNESIEQYLQFSPGVILYGMKALGVPSKSSFERMVVTDAIAAGTMAVVVKSLKCMSKQERPDGSDDCSFPSGHTAIAFMTAAMLSEEYGHVSPWISAGAYSLAATTGVLRIAHNKHYLSDVMVGAGVGILSTKFAYWAMDAFFHDKGKNIKSNTYGQVMDIRNPSFLGVYMGFNMPVKSYRLCPHKRLETSTGTTFGFEGASYFNSYVGLGGRVTISDLHYIINKNEAEDNTLKFYSFFVGPYFSYPLSRRWSVSTKALVGMTYYPKFDVRGTPILSSSGTSYSTGLKIGYAVKHYLISHIFLDLTMQPTPGGQCSQTMRILTLGGNLSYRF